MASQREGGIAWTNETWNPATGCTKVSPGCAHCYIETTMPFRVRGRKFVDGTIPIELHFNRLEQPLHWKTPRRVFVNSLSDLFHEDVPTNFVDRVFAVMALTPQHTYQLLTKRSQRLLEYFKAFGLRQELIGIEAERISGLDRYDASGAGARWTLPLPNVWLGVSVENQHFAEERIPLLLNTPAAVRFISAEPLLGPVDLNALPDVYGDPSWDVSALHGVRECPFGATVERESINKLDWVIVGGESGQGARDFNIVWARGLVKQCRAAGVACFVKQLGARPYEQYAVNGGTFTNPMLGADRLRHRKGGDPDEWPADLRVREFPERGA